MAIFNVNQNRQFYVINEVVSAEPTKEGQIKLGKTADGKQFFFKHFGKGGLTRTDIIDVDNVCYAKETTIDIDAPVSDDGNSTVGDILNLDEEKYSDIEVQEAYDIYKRNLKLLPTGVTSRDRGIFLKKFGIGLPREITPKEIAEQEGLSIARVSQIFQIVEAQIQKNVIKYNIDIDELFDAAKKL